MRDVQASGCPTALECLFEWEAATDTLTNLQLTDQQQGRLCMGLYQNPLSKLKVCLQSPLPCICSAQRPSHPTPLPCIGSAQRPSHPTQQAVVTHTSGAIGI